MLQKTSLCRQKMLEAFLNEVVCKKGIWRKEQMARRKEPRKCVKHNCENL